MAYDEAIADRIRRALGPRPDVTEKKMFGGVAFLRDGKMFCGIAGDDLMVRERYVFVGAPGCKTVEAVAPWVELAYDHVAELPARRRAAPTRAPRFPRQGKRG